MFDMFGLVPHLATVVTTLTIVSHNTSHTLLQSTGSSQGNRKLSKLAGTLHNGLLISVLGLWSRYYTILDPKNKHYQCLRYISSAVLKHLFIGF